MYIKLVRYYIFLHEIALGRIGARNCLKGTKPINIFILVITYFYHFNYNIILIIGFNKQAEKLAKP